MGKVKVGNSLWTDLSNSISRMRAGKQAEDERMRRVKNDERGVELREEENIRQNMMADLQRTQFEEGKKRSAADLRLKEEDAAREQARDNALNTETARRVAEQEGAEPGLRAQILNVDPKAKGLDQMDYASLRAMMQQLQQRQTSREVAILSHRMGLDDQLRALRGMQSMANMNLANVKRARDDAIKRVMSDPMLMKEYSGLIRAKDPEPLRKMIAKVAAGRDLDAEIMRAGQEVNDLKQKAFTMMGVTGSAGPDPRVAAEVDKNMPFALLDPTVQAQITAQISANMKAGKPIDVTEARSRGIPIEQIGTTIGVNIDPVTGAMASPGAVAGAPAPSAFGSGVQAGLTNRHGVAPQVPNTAAAAGVPDIRETSMGASIEAALSPGGAKPGPSRLDLMRSRLGIPAPQTIPPQGSEYPTPEHGLAAASAVAPSIAAPQISSGIGAKPLLPQPGGSVMSPFAPLMQASTLPSAEQIARQLLDQGSGYDEVVAAIPEAFRPLLTARLPKRLPTGGTQQY